MSRRCPSRGAILLVFVVVVACSKRSGGEGKSTPLAASIAEYAQAPQMINVHEHLGSEEDARRLLSLMDELGIEKTIVVGSSRFTLTLDEADGFTELDVNNEVLLRIAREHPGRFEAWPAIDPLDPEKLAKLKRAVADGAKGLKLYLGHGYVKKSDGEYMFHSMALDDERMDEIYAYCQRSALPILFHVQPAPNRGPGIGDEFVAVLRAHPDLKVIAPHFLLSSIADYRLREFLDSFPNLYIDISFGHDSFLAAGLKRISKSPKKFRSLFESYPQRFMWGTDLVITPAKEMGWMRDRAVAYFNMLTRDKYETPLVPGKSLNGLALEGHLLEGILFENYRAFADKKPQGTVLAHEFDYARARLPRNRQPGKMLPPPRRNQ